MVLFAPVQGCQDSKAVKEKVRLHCAASLTLLAQELWNAQDGQLLIQGAGSQTLIRQLEAGARPDLLLLADQKLVDEIPSGLAIESKVVATNSLVLVGTESTEADKQELLDQNFVLALADPNTAPLGRYSANYLSSRKVSCQIAYFKDATAVAAALSSGHADLAVLYKSDLHRFKELRVVEEISADSHSEVKYSLVLLNSQGDAARKYYQSFDSTEAKKRLLDAGFGLP